MSLRAARRCALPSFRELPNAHTAATFEAAAQATRDTGIDLPVSYSHRPATRRLLREQHEFASANFLLAPSQFVYQSFIAAGAHGSQLVRHRYGYDPNRFFPAPSQDRDEVLTAVFIGRGEPAKGLHVALRAWAAAALNIEGARFLIAGTMLPSYGRYLANELAQPGVEVLGFVDDVGTLMRAADVLVLPSYTEGSALVTYEAMASGAIPVVSDASGAPLTNEVSGLVHTVGDVDTLAAHFRALRDDIDFRRRLRTGAIAASADLTWDAAAARLIDAYRCGIQRYGESSTGTRLELAEVGILSPNLRNARRRISRAVEVVRREGPKMLGRRALDVAHRRYVRSHTRLPLSLTDISDSSRLSIPAPPSHVDRGRRLVVGWLTTPPAVGSGGHTTMFRMVEALERAGHTCVLILYDFYDGDVSRHAETIRGEWPTIRAEVRDVSQGFEGLDGCVATAWQTAHVLAARCAVPLRCLFFVQDYEPYFYPHGSEYELAKDSYRFGFRCITIGRGLATLLHNKLGIEADVAEFGCDTDIYHVTNDGQRNGVVMYAKPTVARRGYTHNIAALADFHKRHPEQRIHVFGQAIGDLPFPAIRHGQLTPNQLNALYNETVAGLATSFTNISLVAEEMLAAGNIPVINDSEMSRAGLADPNVVWAEPTPGAMADALCKVVECPDIPKRALAAANNVRSHTWSVGQESFVRAVETEIYGPSPHAEA